MWILLPQDGTQQFCKIFNWKVLRYKMCLSDFYLLTTMQCFVVVVVFFVLVCFLTQNVFLVCSELCIRP